MFFHFHAHKPFFYKDVKAIIMGTLPPPRFCTKDYKKEDVVFPYGSCDNLLWRVLDKIYDLKLLYNTSQEAITQRVDFCHSINLGICDIVESCQREKIDASDIGMSEIKLRPILKFLKEYESIDTIIFTGGSSKNGPEYFLKQVLKEAKIKYEKVSTSTPKENCFIYEGRKIKTIALTSPSNAANRYIGSNEYYKKKKAEDKNYSTLDFRIEQYKKVFDSISS